MKKTILGLLGCVWSFECFASSVRELDGKLYVAPDSIYVASDAIYVNGDFVYVEGISSDVHGIYIQDYETRLMT